VYRVAHNVADTHVLRDRRRRANRLTTLDEIDLAGETPDVGAELVLEAGSLNPLVWRHGKAKGSTNHFRQSAHAGRTGEC
jgi:hypothetical protein